ncbi:hypothetical protein BJX66DRAFT_225660 [Aspergillus keveii]|uniref:Uncharacterized protein n=1 Tax=Aspergillus keveii TaxID=714993 RepID=A0ABR4G315_9EURO
MAPNRTFFHMPWLNRETNKPAYIVAWIIFLERLPIQALLAIYPIVLAAIAVMYEKRFLKHEEIFHPPYHPSIGLSFRLPYITLIPSVGLHPTLMGRHLRSAQLLLFACAVLYSHYLPSPLGSCAHKGEWPDGANVPTGTPTVWDILGTWTTRGKRGRINTIDSCVTTNHMFRTCVALGVLMVLLAVHSAVVLARLDVYRKAVGLIPENTPPTFQVSMTQINGSKKEDSHSATS